MCFPGKTLISTQASLSKLAIVRMFYLVCCEINLLFALCVQLRNKMSAIWFWAEQVLQFIDRIMVNRMCIFYLVDPKKISPERLVVCLQPVSAVP